MDQDRHDSSPEYLPALELYHQLLNVSPDNGDRALLITLRLPNGRYVGDVWLSKQDVADLSDACVGLAAVRDYTDATQLPDPDDVDFAAEIKALENLANGGEA
ncbi:MULTISPECIES: hypothetical protein [Streptomyces rochei group]|uniref:hypothetical protein n=1 Tax=Streptomyces rochei group TaxID=2867164 RepID=UPI0018741CBA|nr:hypothetical protein [Streptomyces vinaceusdrappus]GHC37597.1 hypothetical protein GCM10010308_65290 [Streptomyces vinaceusdrappus]